MIADLFYPPVLEHDREILAEVTASDGSIDPIARWMGQISASGFFVSDDARPTGLKALRGSW